MVKPSEISPNSAALLEKILGKYIDPVCCNNLYDSLNSMNIYLLHDLLNSIEFNEYL